MVFEETDIDGLEVTMILLNSYIENNDSVGKFGTINAIE